MGRKRKVPLSYKLRPWYQNEDSDIDSSDEEVERKVRRSKAMTQSSPSSTSPPHPSSSNNSLQVMDESPVSPSSPPLGRRQALNTPLPYLGNSSSALSQNSPETVSESSPGSSNDDHPRSLNDDHSGSSSNDDHSGSSNNDHPGSSNDDHHGSSNDDHHGSCNENEADDSPASSLLSDNGNSPSSFHFHPRLSPESSAEEMILTPQLGPSPGSSHDGQSQESLNFEAEDQRDYFEMLNTLSKEWLQIELSHKVSKTATNAFWSLAQKMTELFEVKNQTNVNRKTPQFSHQRKKLYENFAPKMKMEIAYRNKSTGEIIIEENLQHTPVSQYPASEFEKLYEIATVEVNIK